MKKLTYMFMAAMIAAQSCDRNRTVENADITREVYVDSVFTNLFLPKGKGFTGGDATYSVVLPDGRTLWIFGDTFLGNVSPDNKRVKTTPLYIRNSFVIVEGDSLRTLHQGARQEFRSMMIPPEVTEGKLGYDELQFWYWPGDAFILDGKLNVFASKFYQRDHDDMWGFEFRGTDLVEFSLPDFKVLQVNNFPALDSVHYGHAVHEGSDFIYVYGLKKEYPYVARAKKNNVRGAWEFYDGNGWVNDAERAAPMLKFSGSEQFSVFEWEGSFVMIMQEGGLGNRIFSFTANTPYGPWENKQLLYETPELIGCKDCFTYNAVAHPQFIEDNYLLISYNMNSMKLQDHYDDALIYRPRFIRVPMEKIIRH